MNKRNYFKYKRQVLMAVLMMLLLSLAACATSSETPDPQVVSEQVQEQEQPLEPITEVEPVQEPVPPQVPDAAPEPELSEIVSDAEIASEAEIVSNVESASDAEVVSETDETADVDRPAGWTAATHSNDVDPDYAAAFPQDTVKEMVITIAPDDWEAMQANLLELLGEPGAGRGGDRGGAAGGNQGAAGGGDFTTENPMWVSGTVEVDGTAWNHVGVRYKGNSSLSSAWRSETDKLPFKLDFDEFEAEYPEIDNQRFYGFKQLSLANGHSDASFLRDAVTYDILAEAGLPSIETAFYQLSIDYGEGVVPLGLYTVVEVIDDTGVENHFGDDSGNIYEGDGTATTFAISDFNQLEASFQKENNSDEADWSDIEALFETLHSDLRNENPAEWRTQLEAQFDVDSFLEWMAISAVIEHWDTYGSMTHNFYLYNDPETNRLTWISWDHNETFSTTNGGGRGGGGRGGGGPNRTVTLDKAEVTDSWPLIRYLLDDPIYYAAYTEHMAAAVDGPLESSNLTEKFKTMATLIAPYAAADVGADTFESAVQQLINYAIEREQTVEAFLQTTN